MRLRSPMQIIKSNTTNEFFKLDSMERFNNNRHESNSQKRLTLSPIQDLKTIDL